jgi:hypothetical protein
VTWLADWAALMRLTRNDNKLFLLITTSVDALVPLRANPLPRTQRPAEGGNRPLVGRHNIREAARPTRSRAAFLPAVPAKKPQQMYRLVRAADHSPFAETCCACNSATGSTSNTSEMTSSDPPIFAFPASKLLMLEKP